MGILPFRSRWLACYEREVYGKHRFRIVKTENPWIVPFIGDARQQVAVRITSGSHISGLFLGSQE